MEAGPRKGTLLVLWRPVRPVGRPPNSSISGYCVYVDGKKVKELHSPTGGWWGSVVIGVVFGWWGDVVISVVGGWEGGVGEY